MNISRDVIDSMFDLSNRELRTQDRYLYQNASKIPIFLVNLSVPAIDIRLRLRIQFNVQHIVVQEHESAYSPFYKMLSYASCRIMMVCKIEAQ